MSFWTRLIKAVHLFSTRVYTRIEWKAHDQGLQNVRRKKWVSYKFYNKGAGIWKAPGFRHQPCCMQVCTGAYCAIIKIPQRYISPSRTFLCVQLCGGNKTKWALEITLGSSTYMNLGHTSIVKMKFNKHMVKTIGIFASHCLGGHHGNDSF